MQVYLNNLDTAASYTTRLLAEILASDALESSFFLHSELERARTSLSLLRNSEEKFRTTLKSGLDHLFNQLVRPKLRPLLSEVYKDVSYKLDEDAYNEAEYRDDVRKRFVKGWDVLMSAYRVRYVPSSLFITARTNVLARQDSLTESNFNLFFSTAVNVLVRPWESMVRGMKFTEVRESVLCAFSVPETDRWRVAGRPPPRPRHPNNPLVPLRPGALCVRLSPRVLLSTTADRDAAHARQRGRGGGGVEREREQVDEQRGVEHPGAPGVAVRAVSIDGAVHCCRPLCRVQESIARCPCVH